MKNLKNLGKALSKAEQKMINGGKLHYLGNDCNTDSDCTEGYQDIATCCFGTCIYLNQNAAGISC